MRLNLLFKKMKKNYIDKREKNCFIQEGKGGVFMERLEEWKRLKQENESLRKENEMLWKTIRQMQKTQDRLIIRYITGSGNGGQ